MTDLEKAARLALEALEQLQGGCTDSNDGTVEAITVWCPEVITALRQALEQPAQQKPVGYVYSVYGERIKNACIESDVPNGAPVYILPQRKPWVGLTDEERKRAIQFNNAHEALAVVIEAKLKEKNT